MLQKVWLYTNAGTTLRFWSCFILQHLGYYACVCVARMGQLPEQERDGWAGLMCAHASCGQLPPAARLDPVTHVRNSSGCLKLGRVMVGIFNWLQSSVSTVAWRCRTWSRCLGRFFFFFLHARRAEDKRLLGETGSKLKSDCTPTFLYAWIRLGNLP